MITLMRVEESTNPKKKYMAIFCVNGKLKITHFGQRGASDYTIHKDIERRERYLARHEKDLNTNDPTRAGYLSYYLLWNKPTLKASIADFKRLLRQWN